MNLILEIIKARSEFSKPTKCVSGNFFDILHKNPPKPHPKSTKISPFFRCKLLTISSVLLLGVVIVGVFPVMRKIIKDDINTTENRTDMRLTAKITTDYAIIR